jgi:phasin family protein
MGYHFGRGGACSAHAGSIGALMEDLMLGNLEEMQKAGKMQMDTMSKSAMIAMRGAQKIASDTADQTRDSMNRFAGYFEKIASAKTLEEAFRIQSEFASGSLERFFSGATRIAETYASVTKESVEPARDAVNAASNVVTRSAQEAANVATRGVQESRRSAN